MIAHGRWFFPGTPASSTTKTGRHNIAEILLKVALKQQKINQNQSKSLSLLTLWFRTQLRRSILDTTYVIKFASDLRQVGGILQQWNWRPRYNWNIVESGVKHHNHYPIKIIQRGGTIGNRKKHTMPLNYIVIKGDYQQYWSTLRDWLSPKVRSSFSYI